MVFGTVIVLLFHGSKKILSVIFVGFHGPELALNVPAELDCHSLRWPLPGEANFLVVSRVAGVSVAVLPVSVGAVRDLSGPGSAL